MEETKEPKKETAVEKKLSLLEEAKETAARIEAGNKEHKELIEQQRQTNAENVLSGTDDQPSEAPKKEVSPEEYAQAAKSGVILE